MLLTSQRGGLVAGQNGIWVCPDYKHKLQVCRGNVEGETGFLMQIMSYRHTLILYLPLAYSTKLGGKHFLTDCQIIEWNVT